MATSMVFTSKSKSRSLISELLLLFCIKEGKDTIKIKGCDSFAVEVRYAHVSSARIMQERRYVLLGNSDKVKQLESSALVPTLIKVTNPCDFEVTVLDPLYGGIRFCCTRWRGDSRQLVVSVPNHVATLIATRHIPTRYHTLRHCMHTQQSA